MTCPNCGQEFEGDRCPNCGRPARSQGSRVAAILVAVFLVLPCAAFGACTVAVGVNSVQNGDTGSALFQCLLFSAVGLAGLFGLIVLVRKLWRG